MGSAIQFERITESDGPAFYELRRSAIRAGCVGYYTPAQIDAMFVLPAHCGRGIGGLMMRHLEDIARDSAVKLLTLDATLNAVGFYRSRGFVGEARAVYRSQRGVAVECVPMTKSLLGF